MRHTASVIDAAHVNRLTAAEVRALAAQLLDTVRAQSAQIEEQQQTLRHKQAMIDQLTHELAVLRRVRFGVKSEALSAGQRSLFEESVDEDLAALEERLAQLRAPAADRPRGSPKRLPLPPHLPRREIRHEPASTVCGCGCTLRRIGEDIAERLDYQPGRFQVERHVRGKWVCGQCRTLVQAPVPAQIVDKGLPTAGLLAHVLVAKYADHLPLYRQEAIYARAGVELSRSTLAQWVGACGVQLQPLVEALKQALLGRAVLHADETPTRCAASRNCCRIAGSRLSQPDLATTGQHGLAGRLRCDCAKRRSTQEPARARRPPRQCALPALRTRPAPAA